MDNPLTLDIITFADRQRIDRRSLVTAADTRIYMDDAAYFMENQIALAVEQDFWCLPLSRVGDKTVKTFYTKVPRNWWQWRRFNKGKEVKRWRHISVDVTIYDTARPLLVFPHANIPKIPPGLGQRRYHWKDHTSCLIDYQINKEKTNANRTG